MSSTSSSKKKEAKVAKQQVTEMMARQTNPRSEGPHKTWHSIKQMLLLT
jgi:hypothetical protein